MEINYLHPIIKNIKDKIEKDEANKTVKDLIWLMYDSSLLTSGFSLEEPTLYTSRIYRLIKLGLSIDDDDDDDLPPLVEDAAEVGAVEGMAEGAAEVGGEEDEESSMEQID